MFDDPASPLLDSALDTVLVSLVAILLLLSILSFTFIIHLRLKSRSVPHLGNFNSLWLIRLLLVSSITLWAIVETFRVPFFRQQYLAPFFPVLTPDQRATVCKLHVVLSLGFFEPVFLLTILFLVNVSIKRKDPRRVWALVFVFGACLPVLLLQVIFVFYKPIERPLPEICGQSSLVFKDDLGNDTILCTYPLMSTVVFAGFGASYSLCFLVSSWKVMSLVINKGLRNRIFGLAVTVLVSLPLQILLLGLSAMWPPDRAGYGGITLGIFLTALACATAGEGILVIRPIADALAAGGDCCQLNPVQVSPINGDEKPETEELVREKV